MTFDRQQVLVTGAGGFIGSHLCERLVQAGARVRAFVRYNSRGDTGLLADIEPHTRAAIEVVAGDLRDYEAVRQAIDGCDIVFHLGALIAIPYSYLHPREVTEVNVLGTLNVLQAARAAGTKRVIHTSTSEVYGTAESPKITEHHRLQGQSPYAASKIAADKLVESFHRSYGLPTVTVRPFNTYGPRQSMRAVIPTIVAQAIRGPRIRIGSLTATRDFTFVTDTADGFIAAARADAVLGEEFNLGTDSEITVGEVIEHVARLLGRPLSPEVETDRLRPSASEVYRLRSDNSKAAARLGWRPTVPFDTGLAAVIEWVQRHAAVHEVHEDRYVI